MRSTHAGREQLCLHFCPYFKPGKNEDLACRGYIVIGAMLDRGLSVPLHRRKEGHAPSPETTESLNQALCKDCSFFEQDCDYILTRGNASACGGFRLLSLLVDEGLLRIEDIR